jgi:hypothetical protein
VDGGDEGIWGFSLSAYCSILFHAPLAYFNKLEALLVRLEGIQGSRDVWGELVQGVAFCDPSTKDLFLSSETEC